MSDELENENRRPSKGSGRGTWSFQSSHAFSSARPTNQMYRGGSSGRGYGRGRGTSLWKQQMTKSTHMETRPLGELLSQISGLSALPCSKDTEISPKIIDSECVASYNW